MEQLREQLSMKAQPLMKTEAFAGVPQGGVGLGSLSEWELLAMVLAGQRKGILPRTH